MESKNEVLTLQQVRKEAVKAQKKIENSTIKWYAIFALCMFGVFGSSYMIGRKMMAVDSIDMAWEAAMKALPDETRDLDI